MKISVLKVFPVALLVVVLCPPIGSPVRAQQTACATQVGPHKPDLIVDQALLRSQIFLTEENFGGSTCTVRENCVTSPGKHQLVRFNASVANIGKTALVIGNPASCGNLFIFDECHQHFHFRNFADYRMWTVSAYQTWVASRDLTQPTNVGMNATLLDMAKQNGQLLVTRKQGFCMTDDAPFLSNAVPAVYQNCDNNQGLSVGWEDQYPPQIPCQFLQIDDLAEGDYFLEVHSNPDQLLPESDYTNNTATVKVHFTPKHGSSAASIQVIG